MAIYYPNIMVHKPLIKLLLRNKRDKLNFITIPSNCTLSKEQQISITRQNNPFKSDF